MNLVL